MNLPAPLPTALVVEPEVRADGRCAECGKPRKIPTTKYASREEHERDPFCSTNCCRRHYGLPVWERRR